MILINGLTCSWKWASESLKFILNSDDIAWSGWFPEDEDWKSRLVKIVQVLENRYKGPWLEDNEHFLEFFKSCVSSNITEIPRISTLAKKYFPKDFIHITAGLKGHLEKITSEELADFVYELSKNELVLFLDAIGRKSKKQRK